MTSPKDCKPNQDPTFVVRGPGITAAEASYGAKGVESGGPGGSLQQEFPFGNKSSAAESAGHHLEAVPLPGAIAGLESLDGHEDDDETEEQGKRGAHEEYVRCVLAFAEDGAEEGARTVGKEDLLRAMSWLAILRYNQHSISAISLES